MLNPPLPGSISTVGQVPAFLGVDVVSKYVARLNLKAPRRTHLRLLRVGSLLADRARRSLRPDQRQPQRDRHGPVPDGRLQPERPRRVVANQSFWKKGQPYMDAMTLKTLPDEQARIAALRAGAIDGATVSSDSAAALEERQRPHRPEGRHGGVPGAADHDQAGRDPSRGTTSGCARRSTSRSTARRSSTRVYGGNGDYSGHRSARLRPVAAVAGRAEGRST